jgi:t-SNARE complex subunit (syntaxin)
MVKFPPRKRASDLAGGRFSHPKIEIRAAQEALTHEAERRTHSNKQRDKLLAIIRRCGFYQSDHRRGERLRVTRF